MLKVYGLIISTDWVYGTQASNVNVQEADPKEVTYAERLTKIKGILSGETSIQLTLQFLYSHNKSDLLILKTIKQSVEPRNSVCHSATIYANAIMHAGTTVDTFLRENLESASATRRCSACEALGRVALDRRLQDNVSIIIVDLGKLHNMKKGSKHVDAAPLCDKIVFNKVKHGLGGNVRLILSGAAPLATHVEAFLRVVACCHVLQGYGLTESCAGTFVSLPNELGMLVTVGPPVPNVDVCLESIPEMGYDALSSTPRGEICIRGDTLFSGYYKREDLTKEVLIDGWLHTGDVGEWQPNGSMKIIDRKKNIFKLSQGEYVAVENLENVYGSVTGINSIWVYGNSFESFLVAVVNPNKQVLERWAEENGVPVDFNSLCENPKAKQNVLVELTRIGKEKKLKGFEFIKAVHLDPEPFDMERDLLTPTFKKKRPQLLKYYQNIVDNMYKGAK
ncbi:Long chain acyl-CoA synthetase 4 [Camellia lanceoleosa]|uniref:Long chain acyl-CoA synthetase 4 n=1 Tax=Camellia lanceoleosa TaxID=1840588 RepID=A0ACC0G428_9ERIC|nr:Long chain acyl-CoA synthetase 4 [Camellia lanceoleosa]